MRIVFYIFGIIGIIAGVFLFSAIVKAPVDLWCRFIGGSAMMAGGVLLVRAGKKNYQGSWPFVIGIALVVFALGGLGAEIDDVLAHKSEDALYGVVMVIVFSASGLLLVWSARKMHHLSLTSDNGLHTAPPPSKRRVRWVAILISFVIVLFYLGLFGYLAIQNSFWKMEVTNYAQSAGRSEAMNLFNKGRLMLYVIDGECDGGKFTGKHEGPFEVWIHFYQPSLGAAHRYSTFQFVEGFNDEMRHLQRGAEKKVKSGITVDRTNSTIK
jgi:hypothetical protein